MPRRPPANCAARWRSSPNQAAGRRLEALEAKSRRQRLICRMNLRNFNDLSSN